MAPDRSAQGSRVFCILDSVIETCRHAPTIGAERRRMQLSGTVQTSSAFDIVPAHARPSEIRSAVSVAAARGPSLRDNSLQKHVRRVADALPIVMLFGEATILRAASFEPRILDRAS